MAGQYWVTWKDESDSAAARKSAIIWGPQANPPAQLQGFLMGGPFQTLLAARTYKNAIGTGAIAPPAGTPIVGDLHIPNPLTGINAIGDFFQRLTQKQTWERVGEVALGGILIYAGLRAVTHGNPAVGSTARKSAVRPVKKVAKGVASVAVPEARFAARAAAKKAAPKTTARVASHRATVAKYGAKKPYTPPPPRPARQPTVRVSHIYHHKGPAKK